MLRIIQLRFKDTVYLTGLVLIAISSIVFCIPLLIDVSGEGTFGIFVLNFSLAVIYLCVLWGNGRLKKRRRGIHTFFVFLILSLISAYSLNREMSVFENSATWFCVSLVLISINYLLFSFLSFIPLAGKHLMSFILGISTLIFIYLTLYLFPFYGIGIAAFFVLGISLHTFVPLLFTIYSIVLVRKIANRYAYLLKSFFAGIVSVILLLVIFIVRWNTLTDIINNEYRNEAINGDETLPAWVRVSQKMPKEWLTEKILKTGIVYSTPSNEGLFFRMPQRNFGEERKHDPFVMVSSLFTDRVQLSEDEKIKILKSMYDSRHEAEERLWSGDNLITEHINTNIKLWAQYRLAYTEKVITVSNTEKTTWQSEEEAIYTFHLPEGGVVTSLSLWINGKEAKGVLTTKEKAAEAYKTIVGVESRDPSVVHWQEGNRVSVRVFPVFSNESRMFKIGITSPLQIEDNKLYYNNIYFDGPSVSAAREDVQINCNNATNVDVPDDFITNKNGFYTKEGKYIADWTLSCNTKELSSEPFNFNGYSYSVAPYQVQRIEDKMDNVYLDINSAWDMAEINKVYDLVKEKNVFVYDQGLQKVNNENHEELFERLKKKRFSLFPFYVIHKPDQSLVITKNKETSPNVDDLKDSDFYQKLNSWSKQPVKLFNLGYSLSPYLQSLKEFRWFRYEQGSLNDLEQLVVKNNFATDEETDDKVIINTAAITLTKDTASVTKCAGPDHLMRLFTYNHIMKKMGRKIFLDSANKSVIEEAQQAYVVSPVSSLVVLESAQDYERFKIQDSNTSLHNATSKTSGAVPEPHEWALIIVALLMAVYIKYPHLFKRLISR